MSEASTIAARVPADLRADLERLAARDVLERKPDGEPSLTPHIRRALRAYVNAELNGTASAGSLFAAAEGASHRGDPATSRQAARDTAPRTGTARRRALGYIVGAREHGRTADELLLLEHVGGHNPAGNGPARRVSELKAAGAIEPILDLDGQPRTRKTRSGSQAIIYVATAKGRRWLREAAR
jgi:hypothetical protein